MTAIVPADEVYRLCRDANREELPRSPRQDWEVRRRLMERHKAHFGPDGRRASWRGRVFAWGLRVFGLGARLVALSLSFPDLPPAFDGYRILQLSDTHLDYLPDLSAVAARLLAGVEVDLLALTGDIHGHHRAPIAASTTPLADLLKAVSVNDRRLAVLGNHDPADMAEALEELGFEVLINRSITLAREDQRIVVTGLDDVHRFYTPDALRALAEAPDGFRIALVHSAEVADHAAAAKYALYLSGHTHGGQICLPGGRPIVTRLRRCRHAGVGTWSEGSMIGYTSCGLGVGDVPLRFNCRGEVSIITLRRSVPQHLPQNDLLAMQPQATPGPR
jgi:predicted MPP superfamily phosphohydrolase